jgi:hypothetical protein|tara:strand:+ start:277 stop:411 length:135 start_codon:yes stop_codon:yes gene_type:complete
MARPRNVRTKNTTEGLLKEILKVLLSIEEKLNEKTNKNKKLLTD